jgi:hypothetical protein
MHTKYVLCTIYKWASFEDPEDVANWRRMMKGKKRQRDDNFFQITEFKNK